MHNWSRLWWVSGLGTGLPSHVKVIVDSVLEVVDLLSMTSFFFYYFQFSITVQLGLGYGLDQTDPEPCVGKIFASKGFLPDFQTQLTYYLQTLFFMMSGLLLQFGQVWAPPGEDHGLRQNR